jgi:hypothetical protein
MGCIQILAGVVKLISRASNQFLGYDVNPVLRLIFRNRSTRILHINPHKALEQLNRLTIVFLSLLRCSLIPQFVRLSSLGMAFSSRWPGAITMLICLIYLFNDVKAQNETEKLPNFGDTVQILGAVGHLSY